MTYRLRNITVAVGLALVAALLTTFYVANYKRHVQQSESTVKVFVAKRDIPSGTLGTDLVAHGWLSTADVVQRTVVPGAITSPQQIVTLTSSQNIYAGEQVTVRRFANRAELGIRSQLHGTLRAVSVPGSGDELLAGTLRDSDHVDVLAYLSSGAARVVVRNLLVLRAPTTPSSKVASGPVSVLLAVSDRKQEQKLFYTISTAPKWSLALRPVAKAIDSPEELETENSVLKDSAGAKELTKLVGVKPQ